MRLHRTLTPIVFILCLLFWPALAHADFQAGVDAYDQGDYATALKEMRPLAEQGHADAQYNLGDMYAKGRGVAQDYVQARDWWLKAAAQGDADTQYNLGLLYHLGQGVPSSITQIALKGWGVHVEQGSNQVGQVFPSDPWDKMLMTVPLPKEISGKDGAPMVLVPAGEFTMGSPDGVGEKEEHPQHTVDLDAFYIDQYEVTTEQYAQFMSATGHSAPEFWDQVDSSRDGKKPVIGINGDDAQTYCDWAGKRLPTEAEWEKAARGTDQRTYPWGDTNPDSRIANFGKDWDSEMYAERLKAVGSYERGKSPYGAYDMVGNVSEWGADWYDKDYYGKSPQKNPHGPSSGVLKVLRGGSWLDSPTYLRSALRYWFNPAYRYANIGVRCAQDAP